MVKQTGKHCLIVEKNLTVNGEEKAFSFEFNMPMGSPFGISYDACFECLQQIVKLAEEATKRAEREKEEKEAVKEEN